MYKKTIFYENSFGIISQWQVQSYVLDYRADNSRVDLDLRFTLAKQFRYNLLESGFCVICDKKLPACSLLQQGTATAFDEKLREKGLKHCEGSILRHWDGSKFVEEDFIPLVYDPGMRFVHVHNVEEYSRTKNTNLILTVWDRITKQSAREGNIKTDYAARNFIFEIFDIQQSTIFASLKAMREAGIKL